MFVHLLRRRSLWLYLLILLITILIYQSHVRQKSPKHAETEHFHEDIKQVQNSSDIALDETYVIDEPVVQYTDNRNTIPEDSLDLNAVENLPTDNHISTYRNTVHLRGFKFCHSLENMSIHKLSWKNVGRSYTPSDAVLKIEDSAKSYFRQLTRDHPNVQTYTTKRYACFMAALGNVTQVPKHFTEKEFLKNVDKKHYFPHLSFTKTNITTRYNLTEKIKAKVAYLVLIHAPDTDYHFKNIEALVESVISPISVVMLHVDQSSDAIKVRLEEWALNRRQEHQQNVFVVRDSEPVTWGTGSMVFAQLKGFFELLDVADWEYVINLSDTDYALRSPEYVHHTLSKHPGRIWINYWKNKETETSRVYRSVLTIKDKPDVIFLSKKRVFSQMFKYPFYKASQWMILPRDFVWHLRQDASTVNFLAWIEHAWVPDEFFFPSVALLKSDKWKNRVVNENKRYISPFKGLHPQWIDDSTLPILKELSEKDQVFYVRKLQNSNHPNVKAFLDSEREEFDKKLLPQEQL